MSRVAIFTDSASDLDPAEAASEGIEVDPAARDVRPGDVQGRRRAVDDRVLGADGRPGRAVPDDRGLVAGRLQGRLRGRVRGRRRGDRLDPRRGQPVGHDQERPDRPGHAARPRDPRRRLARRLDGARGSSRGWRSELAADGRPAADIAEILEARAPDMRIYVALETLEYLKKGGRISGAQAAIGTLLSVKPIIAGQATAWSRPSDQRPDAVEGARAADRAHLRAARSSGWRSCTRSAPTSRRSATRSSPRARRSTRRGRDDRPGRGVGRAAPRAGLRRSGDPVSRRRRPRAQRCDKVATTLADRYHRVGASPAVSGYTRAEMSRASAIRRHPAWTRRRAPWGRPGDDPRSTWRSR